MAQPSPHQVDLPVPNPLLNTLLRRVEYLPMRRAGKSVQQYDQKIQAQMIVDSWRRTLADNHLPGLFDDAQVNLAHEPHDACRELSDAFGPQARKQLALASRALDAVQAELAKDTPSQQIMGSALKYALGELRDLHERIESAVRNACEDARHSYHGEAPVPMLHDSPMRAVETLQGLVVALEAQGPEILGVVKREAAPNIAGRG